jgi:O-acetyl-ADP-ribose deacetylase (regulator of RNase III)
MQVTINHIILEISDIPLLDSQTEAIVNDTDSALTIPSWLVDAAGDSLVQEASLIGWCDMGAATITKAGKLDFKRIIHVVGPRWGDDSARGKLANATWAVLQLAESESLVSLALPPLSTGANGYPIENCAKMMLEQAIDYTFEPLQFLQHIIFCIPFAAGVDIFEVELQRQLEDLRNADDSQIRVN